MDIKEIFSRKKELRKVIASKRAEFSDDEIMKMSAEVMNNLEQIDAFRRAKTIFVYHSTPGEVDTRELIKKYKNEKEILLPVVGKEGLFLRKYTSDENLHVSKFGISEPTGEIYTDYDKIDFIVVPGMAFDRQMNRMGYGKAYYDRLLPKINAVKAAVCFSFQIQSSVPHTSTDVKMDMIVCQDEIIV